MRIGPEVPLDELINNNGTIVTDQFIFSNFDYSPLLGNSEMPSAEFVLVAPIKDSFGNIGLKFEGGWGDSAITNGPSNATLYYDLAVVNTMNNITGVVLNGDPTIDEIGSVQVTERFLPPIGSTLPLDTYDDFSLKIFDVSTPDETNTTDSLAFNQSVKSIRIVKDIRANAFDSFPVSITTINQLYHTEPIPEPSAYLLLTLMGTAIGVYRYRLG